MKLKPTFALMAAFAVISITASPLGASESDPQIEAAVKESYVFKNYLAQDSIKAESKDGIVTLSGTVASEAHKGLAQNTAAGVSGVSRVDNQLEIQDEESSEEGSSSWLGWKTKFALMFHRHVSGTGTSVSVKNGVATLRGEASSLAQKELTGAYAADIEGVTSVNNELTVTETPAEDAQTISEEKIDDASITAQILTSLDSYRSTSGIDTGVQTTDGVVTVTGIARNDAEKRLVTMLANDIKGVGSVINNMTVKEAAGGE